MLPSGITLRPQTEADLPFAAALYAATREQELRAVDWPDDIKRTFLQDQFTAQWAHYSHHYFDADFSIIEREGRPIGRLYVWQAPADVRIVDIALVDGERGRGVGTSLLAWILRDAAAAGKTVSIHVEQFNPALRLYQRLGFQQIDTHGVYFLMKWRPSRVDDANGTSVGGSDAV